MAFEDTWNAVQSKLFVGMQVRNWTANKGLLGNSFGIVEVNHEGIVVDPPGSEATTTSFD